MMEGNKGVHNIIKENNLGVDFDDAFKADNQILSVVSRANVIISWMIRNFISREVNVALKYSKS